MQCPECRATVPDSMIACPVCAEKRSAEALRKYQYHALKLVTLGHGSLHTRAIHGVRHVKQFGAERTFCGEHTTGHHRPGTVRPDDLSGVCEKCRAAVVAAIEEVLGAP